MMTFNDSVHKCNLQNKEVSDIKNQQVLSSLGFSDVGIFLRDGPFISDTEIVSLHPSKATHCVCYINENYFDSYGVVCPEKLSKFIMK